MAEQIVHELPAPPEAVRHGGVLQGGTQRSGQAVHRVGRRAAWGEDAEPGIDRHPGKAGLGGRRHIGEVGKPLRRADGQRPQPPFAHQVGPVRLGDQGAT